MLHSLPSRHKYTPQQTQVFAQRESMLRTQAASAIGSEETVQGIKT